MPKITVDINRLTRNLAIKRFPDAKFETGSSNSSSGDMMSQDFPQKKGTSREIRLFTPGKWI